MNCVGNGWLAGRFGIPCKPQDSGIAYAGFQIAVTDDAPLSIDPPPTDFQSPQNPHWRSVAAMILVA